MKKILFFLPLLFTACIMRETDNNIKDVPTEKFTFIEQKLEYEACDKLNGNCLSDMSRNAGSGVIIANDEENNKTYVLTVEHLCEDPEAPDSGVPGISLNIINHFMVVNDHFGKQHRADILHVDKQNDLCLLGVEYLDIDPVKFGNVDLQPKEKIWNIAAPMGHWSPGAIIVFDGYYNGESDDGRSVYSLPTAPGSSGSPILNQRKELVGIINIASTSYLVGFGPNRQDIQNFIKINLPTE